MIHRKKRNSSRINLIISSIFHGALILAIFYFAAREGMLGKKLKQLTVTMVQKEKKPEPPKEKPPEPKVEPPKAAPPPKAVVDTPKVQSAPPPAVAVAPAAAPPASALPAFEFADGAKEVKTLSNPTEVYKALIEHTFLSHWNRPEGIADDSFVAQVEV